MFILLSIMIITWKAIVGQKKEIDLNNSEHANNPNQIRSIDDEINVPSSSIKKKKRLIIALLCVWSFFNFLFFLIPFGFNLTFEKTNKFFPFTYDTNKDFSKFFDIRYYDFTELFFYVGGVWFLYFFGDQISELLSKNRVINAIVKLKIEITKNKDKLIVSSLCIWSFINAFVLLKYFGGSSFKKGWAIKIDQRDLFYPFTYSSDFRKYDIRFYDYTEFFVYVGGAWLIYFLYRYLKGSKLKP